MQWVEKNPILLNMKKSKNFEYPIRRIAEVKKILQF